MLIKSANFVISNENVRKLPAADRPEYAFIGRSNVGKSSLINMLTDRRKLAKVSGSPGKTITINHFLINEDEKTQNKGWYLVDLPGYGYARRSKAKRQRFEKFIRDYCLLRSNLVCMFLLVDCRIPPQKVDIDFANTLGENQVPFRIIFTKTDKKRVAVDKNVAAFMKELKETWEELPKYFLSSSETRVGKAEILDFIDELNRKALN